MEIIDQVVKSARWAKHEEDIKEIASTYWHIGNSGVSFGIIDNGNGPCFTVQSSSFGNMQTIQKFYTDKKSLEALRDIIDIALKHEGFSEEYVEKAEVQDYEINKGNLIEPQNEEEKISKEAGWAERARELDQKTFNKKFHDIKDLNVFEKEIKELDEQKLKQLRGFFIDKIYNDEESETTILDMRKSEILQKLKREKAPKLVPLPKAYRPFIGI